MTLDELDVAHLPTQDQDNSLPMRLLRLAKIRRRIHDNHAAALLCEAADAVAQQQRSDVQAFDKLCREAHAILMLALRDGWESQAENARAWDDRRRALEERRPL
jgi:hypothetical protein